MNCESFLPAGNDLLINYLYISDAIYRYKHDRLHVSMITDCSIIPSNWDMLLNTFQREIQPFPCKHFKMSESFQNWVCHNLEYVTVINL